MKEKGADRVAEHRWIGSMRRYATAGGGEKQTIVLHGREEATVYGCKRILAYSPNEICFGMHGDCLWLTGERMYCSSFVSGTVTVLGRIDSFSYGKERGTL